MKKKIAVLIIFAFTLSIAVGVGTFSNPGASAQTTVAQDTTAVAQDTTAAAATMAPTYKKITATQAVTTTNVNIREGVSTSHKIVCTLKKGDKVVVFGKIGKWYTVYAPNNNRCVGVVSSKYLKMTGTTTAKTTKPRKTTTTTTPGTTGMGTAGTPQISTPETAITGPAGITAAEQELLDLVNKARKDAGIAPLNFDADLVKCARAKAKDMVAKGYFSHTSPSYGSPFEMMRQFNVSYRTAGENIAGNQTVKGAFDAWMKSEGHRKNILNSNFNFCGFGIEPSPSYGKILVQQFIGR